MVFNLEKMIPRKRQELADDKRKAYAAHYAARLERYGYMRDSQNAKAFDQIADYFGQWFAGTSGEADLPPKGMFLFGNKGTGKTTAMNIFSGLFGIEIIKIEELTKAYAIGKDAEFWRIIDDLKWSHLIIDDICNEHEVKSYGNSIPIDEMLKQREALWKYNGIYTFYTSNAKGRSEISALYGDTITSRLLGSCEFIRVDGNDRRLK